MVGVVGLDPVTISPRFDFGTRVLRNGLDVEPVVIGLLAVSELFRQARQTFQWSEVRGKRLDEVPVARRDPALSLPSMFTGTVTGTFIGAVPGAGGLTGALISYQQAQGHLASSRRSSARVDRGHRRQRGRAERGQFRRADTDARPRHPGQRHVGAAAQRADHAGHGAGTMAVDQQRPSCSMRRSPVCSAGRSCSPFTGWWLSRSMMKVVTINRSAVIVLCLAIVMLGVFTLQGIFDVWCASSAAIIGYFMMRYGYSVAAPALAAILSSEFERTLRQGLNLTNNSVVQFVTRPLTAAILLAALAVLILGIVNLRRERRRVAALTAKLEETHPDAALLIDPDADPAPSGHGGPGSEFRDNGSAQRSGSRSIPPEREHASASWQLRTHLGDSAGGKDTRSSMTVNTNSVSPSSGPG